MALFERKLTPEQERKKKEEERIVKKLKEYNYSPGLFDHPDSDHWLLGYIKEYESVCKKKYENPTEETNALLKLIAKQNLLLLAELRDIYDAIPEGE